MEKLTDKHLEIFKAAVKTWLREFGIPNWRVYFSWSEDNSCKAQCSSNLRGRAVTFLLAKEWPDSIKPTEEELHKTARHEVLHLLFARLEHLALERFASEAEIHEADEEIVRLLESFIDRQ